MLVESKERSGERGADHRGSLSWRGPLAATGAGVALNLVIYSVAKSVGLAFVVPTFGGGPETMTINASNVVASTLVGFAVGWLAALGAARAGRPSQRAVAFAGAVVVVISCALPLSLDATIGVRVGLALMHLVVGSVFIGALPARGGKNR